MLNGEAGDLTAERIQQRRVRNNDGAYRLPAKLVKCFS
jgi:hypothetical protein